MGKTALSLAPQLAAILAKKRVLNFSLEMTAAELVQRAICKVGRISHSIFEREDGVPDEKWSFIHEAARLLHDAPWLIDDQPGLTQDQICSRARQHHMEEPLELIVVDHMGLIQLPKRGSRNDELGEVSYGLKNLSKELNVPVLALLQLNRGLEDRTDKRPIMRDIRDSGNIEQDMDVIVSVYRDDVYHHGSLDTDHAEISTMANRHGRGGTAFVHADLEHMTYDAPKHERRCFPAGANSANSSRSSFSGYGKTREQSREFSRTGSDG
jgi:replicative DNA helicase